MRRRSPPRLRLALLSLPLVLVAAVAQPLLKAGMEGEPPILADGFEAPVVPGAPIADAGPDRNVAVGDPQVLDGSGSRDQGGQPLRYRWVLKSRPAGSQAELREATTANPALVPDVAGAYWLELTVNNGVTDSAPDTLRVRAFTNFGIDSDGDSLGDALELTLGLDPYNEDSFGDGVRDAERDLDNDGLTIRQELLYGLDPLNPDTDGDGARDGDEDFDFDGLGLLLELQRGTNPLNADSDGDGFGDGWEEGAGSNPRDPASVPRSWAYERRSSTLTRERADELTTIGYGLSVAGPSNGLSVTRERADELITIGYGLTVAGPSTGLSVSRERADELTTIGYGPTVAGPSNGLSVTRERADELTTIGYGLTVAGPSNGLSVTRERANELTTIPLGTTVARPPASVRRNP